MLSMFSLFGISAAFWIIPVAIQVFFAVHCIRHGKPAWLFIILFFPMVGSLVYFIVEYLPASRPRESLETTARRVKERINPAAEIQRLEDQVALSNSLNNRMALARAYLRAGRVDDAIALYTESLKGLYENEPSVLYELSTAYLARGELEAARETFERLRRNASLLSTDHLLLSAHIFEEAGDLEGAAREYAAILTRPVTGEEVRCRYALVLRQLGRDGETVAG